MYISRIKNAGPKYNYSEFGENTHIYKFEDAVCYDKIDFKKFADNAVIEFHGCLAGYDLCVLDNIAEEFSEALYAAGNRNAVVIAHQEKSHPEKGSYRNGKHVVYRNSKKLMETTESGDITKKN